MIICSQEQAMNEYFHELETANSPLRGMYDTYDKKKRKEQNRQVAEDLRVQMEEKSRIKCLEERPKASDEKLPFDNRDEAAELEEEREKKRKLREDLDKQIEEVKRNLEARKREEEALDRIEANFGRIEPEIDKQTRRNEILASMRQLQVSFFFSIFKYIRNSFFFIFR